MKQILLAILLVLPSAANAACGNRTFTIDKPISEVINSIQNSEDLGKMLDMPGINIISLTTTEDKKDPKNKLDIQGQIKIQNKQTGNLELWFAGSLKQADHYMMLHLYTTKTQGKLAFLNTWAIISKKTETVTKVELHGEMQVRIPYFRLRIVRRIVSREVNNFVCGLIQQSLCQTEKQLRKQIIK